MCFSEANAAASGVSFPTASVVAAGGRNRISTVMPRSMRANNDSNALLNVGVVREYVHFYRQSAKGDRQSLTLRLHQSTI